MDVHLPSIPCARIVVVLRLIIPFRNLKNDSISASHVVPLLKIDLPLILVGIYLHTAHMLLLVSVRPLLITSYLAPLPVHNMIILLLDSNSILVLLQMAVLFLFHVNGQMLILFSLPLRFPTFLVRLDMFQKTLISWLII